MYFEVILNNHAICSMYSQIKNKRTIHLPDIKLQTDRKIDIDKKGVLSFLVINKNIFLNFLP